MFLINTSSGWWGCGYPLPTTSAYWNVNMLCLTAINRFFINALFSQMFLRMRFFNVFSLMEFTILLTLSTTQVISKSKDVDTKDSLSKKQCTHVAFGITTCSLTLRLDRGTLLNIVNNLWTNIFWQVSYSSSDSWKLLVKSDLQQF